MVLKRIKMVNMWVATATMALMVSGLASAQDNTLGSALPSEAGDCPKDQVSFEMVTG